MCAGRPALTSCTGRSQQGSGALAGPALRPTVHAVLAHELAMAAQVQAQMTAGSIRWSCHQAVLAQTVWRASLMTPLSDLVSSL